MQAQNNPHSTPSSTSFYKECASYPELPKFRLFTDRWAKKLYDDVEELLGRERELNDALAALQKSKDWPVLTALECPRSDIRGEENTALRAKWTRYEEMLRLYSQDLCLSHQLVQLPSHASYCSKRLGQYQLIHDGIFGPTNERDTDATEYADPKAPGFAAWTGIDGPDILTSFYINHSRWFEDNILRWLRALIRRRSPTPGGSQQTTVRLSTLSTIIDLLTCTFVPLFLTAAMYALVIVPPLKGRIAVVGAFGLVFAFSARLISGGMSRGEIFAFTAGFFAVASVFVSGTDNQISKTS